MSDLSDKVYSLKAGDTLPPLECRLRYDNGDPVEHLDNAESVSLYVRRRGTQDVARYEGLVVDAETATVRYEWAKGETEIAGVYDAEWLIDYRDGNRITVPNNESFTIMIHPRLHDRVEVPSAPLTAKVVLRDVPISKPVVQAPSREVRLSSVKVQVRR
jgi:hypothetical protein